MPLLAKAKTLQPVNTGRFYTKKQLESMPAKQAASVTTIIKDVFNKADALIPWACNCMQDYLLQDFPPTYPNPVEDCADCESNFRYNLDKAKYAYLTEMKKAAQIGTNVHNSIDMFLNNKPQNFVRFNCEEESYAFNAFLDWFKHYTPEIIATEQAVWGIVNGYCWAGRCDLICEINNEVYLIDFKTSKKIYKEHHIQVAGYSSATSLKNNKISEIQQGAVLRLPKTKKDEWEFKKSKLNANMDVFNKAVALYYAYHPIIAKKCEVI